MKVRIIDEEKIRMMDFYFARTHVMTSSERDVFLPVEDGEDLEIHVCLKPCRTGGTPASMVFESVSVVNVGQGGLPLRVMGEDGRTLDNELVEVLAWEKLEDDESVSEDYNYGRMPAHIGGRRAPAGSVIERQVRPDEYCASPDF